jgi:hypothetical protein
MDKYKIYCLKLYIRVITLPNFKDLIKRNVERLFTCIKIIAN